jgi:hypothetical protein
VFLIQVVAAILLILGSLLVLYAVSRSEASPPPGGHQAGPRLVPRRGSSPYQDDEDDWRRAA